MPSYRYLLIYHAASQMTEWTAFILLNVGKVANAVTFGGVFNFTAELFPTELRTSAVGIGKDFELDACDSTSKSDHSEARAYTNRTD